ncbi:MAG TPA: protein kinase [Chloroflexi bacterium]|jgi:serine/threonine protein kinase|nr:protein kinase [Chloroflexota bacterium]
MMSTAPRLCPHCHREVRPQSRFCPHCGQGLGTTAADPNLLNGGNYRIIRSLTRGGMGQVFLAEDLRAFDRPCIVKQMIEYYDPSDPEERRRAQERFEEEGRTLASLNHPGVPKIYSFFAENGRFYIVMEYVEGENLETYVTHIDDNGTVVRPVRRLQQEEVLRAIIQVARILEYLHTQPRPVVHQDIKPANLILERQLGYARLVDFGTARVEIPPGAAPGNGQRASIYGTDGYAPPEQYQGKPVPRSDVFALAATAYHLLTDDDPREHPFKFPRLADLPHELRATLERALRTDPNERITAAELYAALETLATPSRTLEAFTFPGGVQIRSVGALPALVDEHWDAARSFLYNGDFQRWLRDINRHDLVVAADEIIKEEPNHDAGLEHFVRVVDPGLPKPVVTVDPPAINLGSIARESALIRRVTVLNTTRGYSLARVSASQPWIEVFPAALNLWASIPADVRVQVRAEGLPFRSRQHGEVTIEAPDQDPIVIPVTAQVSLTREVWRLIRRALRGAIPEAWRSATSAWRRLARVASSIRRPFAVAPWLLWIVWLALAAAIGAGLYYLPPFLEGLSAFGLVLRRPQVWADYVAPMLLGPPFLVSAGWLVTVFLVLVIATVAGAVRGVWKSFFR